MSRKQIVSRRGFIVFGATAAAGTALLAACQPPQTVEKIVEKPVEKIVEKSVQVTKIVEKTVEQTKVVEKQVIVTAAPKPKERVEIIFQSDWLEGGARTKVMTQAIDLWHKTYKPRLIARMGEAEDLYKSVVADAAPDVTLGAGSVFRYWCEEGVLLDISDFLKAKNYDWSDIIKHEEFYTWKGKYVGLPFQYNIGQWAVNKTMLENAGVQMPDMQKWTWDGMLDIGQKVTKADKNIFSHKRADWIFANIPSFGGDYFNADGTKTTIAEGGALDYFQTATDWIHKWKVHPTFKYISEQKLSWGAGSYAFDVQIAQGKQKFEEVQLLPPIHSKTGKRSGDWLGQPHWITTWSKKRDVLAEAVDLVIFMASDEVQAINLKENGAAPFRLKFHNTDAFAPKATRDTILECNKFRVGLGFERARYWRPWWSVTYPFLMKIFNGEVPVKEGLAQATEAGNKALAGEMGLG